jgi:hypothetical protein
MNDPRTSINASTTDKRFDIRPKDANLLFMGSHGLQVLADACNYCTNYCLDYSDSGSLVVVRIHARQPAQHQVLTLKSLDG